MEAKLIAIAIETFQIVLELAFPVLFVAMIIGLIISIFQATTQINEMTLTFVPKVLGVVLVLVLLMPWMIQKMMEFTSRMFGMMGEFIF